MKVEQIRTFIAIELSPAFRIEIEELQVKLKASNPLPAKWVKPNGTHLTLTFLGNVGEDLVSTITLAMERAAEGVNPFLLRLGHMGVFPSLNRVQVIWVGLEGKLDNLLDLKNRLESELTPLGFQPEERNFTPHLTLARLRDRLSLLEREQLAKFISRTSPNKPIDMDVTHVSLMRSFLSHEGASYRCLAQAPLKF